MKTIPNQFQDLLKQNSPKKLLNEYEELLTFLLEMDNFPIGSEHKFFAILKELVLLRPKEKLSILSLLHFQVSRQLSSITGAMVLPDSMISFIILLIQKIFSNKEDDISIYYPDFGMGYLALSLVENYPNAKLWMEEMQLRFVGIQRNLAKICNIDARIHLRNNLEVRNRLSVDLAVLDSPGRLLYATKEETLYGESIIKTLEDVREGGYIIAIVKNSFLYEDSKVRKEILEKGDVLCIIEFPDKLYAPLAYINVSIMIIRKKSKDYIPKYLLVSSMNDLTIKKENTVSIRQNEVLDKWEEFLGSELYGKI